jgi:hypothetical protein
VFKPLTPPPLRFPMMRSLCQNIPQMLRTVAIAGTLARFVQGRTAQRVMIHADSRATNFVDQKMM